MTSGQLFVCGWTVLAVGTTWHVQDHQKSSARIAQKSSLYKVVSLRPLFSQAVSCPGRVGLPAWNLYSFYCRWESYGEIFACLRYDVCCVLCAASCFSSHVSPARPWQKASNRTPPWRGWICFTTRSEMKGRRRGVWWEWCHEGRGSEGRPYESDIREMTKGNAMQPWFPDAFIQLKFVMTSDWGILMYLACKHVLARSWCKRETIHNSSISKTGHPVMSKF